MLWVLVVIVGASLAAARNRVLINGHPLPLPLGEVAERSEDGEGRHVKKICQWHIFSVDLSGYAAVASFLVSTASSFSSDRGGYILLRFPKFRSGI